MSKATVLKLSWKQGKDVLWNSKEIRVKRNGSIYYVYFNHMLGELEAKDWTGRIYTNIIITTDFEC